jgi:catechol 2,3-dioxygenase-like lactoylglutathione lyase family enzyme
MALKILEFHHQALRMDPCMAGATVDFYTRVLGLDPEQGRQLNPDRPLPVYRLTLPDETQIHLLGVNGKSPFAESADRDPTAPHAAFAVPDIAAAEHELDKLGIDHWQLDLEATKLVFFRDPAGNQIEVHQIGACQCRKSNRRPL